jgi:TatD DNase family protein
MLLDAHCHLDLYRDFGGVLASIEAERIATIAVTNAPSVYRKCVELTAHNRFVRVAAGLHPQLVAERAHELPLLLELIPETTYIGEVGLDFSEADAANRAAQRHVFEQILAACAATGDRVLSVHSRRAAADVIAMIGDRFRGSVILHWFSGPASVLTKAIAAGLFFSINPAMFVSEQGRKLIARIPRDRILTESDGPFVAVSGRPAEPADVVLVGRYLAAEWSVDERAVQAQIIANFKALRGTLRDEGEAPYSP